MRSLSIDLAADESAWSSSFLHLSFSRLDDPIPLDQLDVQLRTTHTSVYRALHTTVLPRLNPTSFTCSLLGEEGNESVWLSLSRAYPTLDSWTRTEELRFVGGIVYSQPCNGPLLLGSIPQPFLHRRRIVRIQVDVRLVASVLLRLARGRSFGFEGMQDGSMRLVVKSEEEKVAAEEIVRASSEIERWRRVFAVEVEP